ncbi:MAG: RHS repeat protein, partial [bacterium]|nr:RHS repeat protein [bacterium]
MQWPRNQMRIEVCPVGPCPSQSRFYTWHGRGFMIRERLPEIGITGNGDVDYELDAIGQLRRKTDPEWDLRYVYDDGGRLIRIQEDGGRIWKEWVWCTSNAGGNYRRGRVTRAIRHNHMLTYSAPTGLTTVATFIPTGPVVQLALVEGTGQVWLAKGNHFWSFDVNGTELFDLGIRYLVSLSIDQAQGLTWVATTHQVA